MPQERTYLSCADTAKLVRKALAADFPGIKFSVRSKTYAGGASITVSWTDGPLSRDVDGTLGLYQGASFDGMIDLKSYHDSILMGEDGPRLVHFGADFIHGSRSTSDVRRAVYRQELRRFLAHIDGSAYDPNKSLPVQVCGGIGQPELQGQLSHDAHGRGEWGSSVVEQMGWNRRWTGERCPGSNSSYCEGCGRWQAGHELEPHLR